MSTKNSTTNSRVSESAPASSGGKFFIYGFLILCSVLVIYPMFWLVATSLKDSWGIFENPWALPGKLHWDNYSTAMKAGELAVKFWNSIIVDGISLVFILLISSMAAYVLARFKFVGNRTLYYLFLSGMTIPVFLAVVPLFDLMNKIHVPGFGSLLNTRVGLIVIYVAYSLSFTIFILHGFFRTLPWELAEAAVIDGCSPNQVFRKIMLPLAKPGLTTAGIFVFIGLWNEFPLALVLVSEEKYQTLPLGIANLAVNLKFQADWGALFAGLTIGVIPTVVLFSFFQKHIQEGMTAGAVK